ncbi:MAG TPA: hypothetical protein VE173_05705, partial [Longimicrobiales bacterium]|nr:hypothetical protein [Longimicrobiales bacterium]
MVRRRRLRAGHLEVGERVAPAFLFGVTRVAAEFDAPEGTMGKPFPEVERELGRRVEALGFELVDVEWAGSARRPIFRIRIDVPGGSDPRDRHGGVTVDDCAVVSRGLEPWLDGLEGVPETYVLEVSSPGVERALTREAD